MLTAVWIALPLGLTAACQAGGGPTGQTPTPSDPPTAVVADGAALYAKYCAVCHGEDGRTVESVKNAPRLNSQGLLEVADDAFLFETIRQGRPGVNGLGRPGTAMPIFGAEQDPVLTDAQIQAIVAHLRTWQVAPSVVLGPYQARGDPAAGATLYAEACAVCHGADGWGVEAPRLAGSTFQSTASDAFIRYTIQYGRPDTKMKGFPYDETQLGDLIAFIRTLDDSGEEGR